MSGVPTVAMTAPANGSYRNNKPTFYSVVTDALGLVQPPPAAAQATTKVVVPMAPPPRVTQIAGTGRTTNGLTTITVSFNEALNPGSADNPNLYIVDGGVTKRGKTVYTNKLAVRNFSYNAKAHTVTITLAKPFKGAVQVTVLPGIRAANCASSSGSFSAVVMENSVAIATDQIAVGLGAERPPDRPVDSVLDEPHAAVAEAGVDAAGVHADGAVAIRRRSIYDTSLLNILAG